MNEMFCTLVRISFWDFDRRYMMQLALNIFISVTVIRIYLILWLSMNSSMHNTWRDLFSCDIHIFPVILSFFLLFCPWTRNKI